MPFNGSGVFVSLPPPTYPPVAHTKISSSYFIANLNDIFGGLSNCLTRNGQSAALANLPMGGFKLTNLGDGSSSADSAAYHQIGDAVAVETTRAEAAEATLQTNINTQVAAETTRAEGAETTLQTNITNEATTRAGADTTLQNNINAEATTRAAADTTLQTNINAKVSTTDFTGANQSLGASGFQKFPGGLLLQWGVVGGLTGASILTINFPRAFSGTPYAVIPVDFTSGGAPAVAPGPYYILSLAASNFEIETGGASSPDQIMYVAIGPA